MPETFDDRTPLTREYLSICHPEACERDPNSGEIWYCTYHYEQIMIDIGNVAPDFPKLYTDECGESLNSIPCCTVDANHQIGLCDFHKADFYRLVKIDNWDLTYLNTCKLDYTNQRIAELTAENPPPNPDTHIRYILEYKESPFPAEYTKKNTYYSARDGDGWYPKLHPWMATVYPTVAAATFAMYMKHDTEFIIREIEYTLKGVVGA